MRYFLRYSLRLIVDPRDTIHAILLDTHRVNYGFLGLLLLSSIYILSFSISTINAAKPFLLPLLRMPPGEHTGYLVFPAAIAATILQAGTIRLVARSWNGAGCFEDLFALLGFNHIIVAFVVGLPNFLLSALRVETGSAGIHVVFGTLWYLMLALLTVREVEDLEWGKSAIAAMAGFLADIAVQIALTR